MYQTFHVYSGVSIEIDKAQAMRLSVDWAPEPVNLLEFLAEGDVPEWLSYIHNDDDWLVVGESLMLGGFEVVDRIAIPGIVRVGQPAHVAELEALLDEWGIEEAVGMLAINTW